MVATSINKIKYELNQYLSSVDCLLVFRKFMNFSCLATVFDIYDCRHASYSVTAKAAASRRCLSIGMAAVYPLLGGCPLLQCPYRRFHCICLHSMIKFFPGLECNFTCLE